MMLWHGFLVEARMGQWTMLLLRILAVLVPWPRLSRHLSSNYQIGPYCQLTYMLWQRMRMCSAVFVSVRGLGKWPTCRSTLTTLSHIFFLELFANWPRT